MLVAAVIGVLSFTGTISADMENLYKSGEIQFIPDPAFGINTDWDSPSLYKLNSLTVADDGAIYAAISRQHKLCKFDANGKLLFTFGKRGQGPGDTIQPKSLSILDNKYLLVNELLVNRKISLFHLDGRIYKVIKAANPVHDSIALKNNRIAIYTINSRNSYQILSVYIKDIVTGKEIPITQKRDKSRMIRDNKDFFMGSAVLGIGYIRRTVDGHLLVAFNYDNEIGIYDENGQKKRSIVLQKEPVKVNSAVISRYKRAMIHHMEKTFKKPGIYIRKFKGLNGLERIFSAHLPFFSNIMVDGHGNILVFDYYFGSEKDFPPFQVYSAQGDFIGNARFNFKPFNIPRNDINTKDEMKFRDNYFYGLFDREKAGDTETRIIKVNFD